ncbi:MAG: DUF3313 family protein [Myxococcota bacterium]|jgi:hypothetical protein|nr:DUF3313 family protein [Myxococcota bacterium]
MIKSIDTSWGKNEPKRKWNTLVSTRLVLGVMLVGAFGCVSPNSSGIYYKSGEGTSTLDGLHQTRWAPFQATFLRPGVDMDSYKRVVIEPLSISYRQDPGLRRVGNQAFGTYEPLDPNYPLTGSARGVMETVYLDYLKSQLIATGHFDEVTVGAVEGNKEGVLILRGQIIDLVISVASMINQPPSAMEIVDDSGQMTLFVDFIDASTGSSIIQMADARQIRGDHDYYVSEGVSQLGALRMIFGEWAGGVRRQIEQLSALGEIPTPEG